MTILHTSGGFRRRDIARVLAGSAALAAIGPAARAAPKSGGAITVATIGEPPTLDPMESTADVVGIIAQHMFETLYTWGDGWRIVPLLAASDPDISADGRIYTIPLRAGVKFHDGTVMSSADVLASLNRWMSIATRGRQTKDFVDTITAPDANTIRVALKKPFAPLLSLLS
jgi:peptide/nickel transport system substrate-binding protein